MSSAKLLETRLCAFLFHFVEHDSVQATADASFQSERHVFRRILPCWAFSSRKSRFRGLAAPQPGDVRGFPRPGQVAVAAACYYFPKALNWGRKIFLFYWRRGCTTWCRIGVLSNIFSTKRVLLFSAESVFRTWRCRDCDFIWDECWKTLERGATSWDILRGHILRYEGPHLEIFWGATSWDILRGHILRWFELVQVVET